MNRIYDGRTLVDWGVDPNCAMLPVSDEDRARWGWKQDADGDWYRDLPEGQRIDKLPATAA